jgi:hypothetical protein
MATGLRPGKSRFKIPAGKKRFLFFKASKPLIPIQRPIQWVFGALFAQEECGRCGKLTTPFHLVPRLRITEAIALTLLPFCLPAMNRDNFYLHLLVYYLCKHKNILRCT